jgi:hypothetical protein
MPWHILDIAPTADEREIRRAYARQLKSRQHEDDAEFFSRLRWAYETALTWAREDFSEDYVISELFEPSDMKDSGNPGETEDIRENPSKEIFSQGLPDETGHFPEAQDASSPPVEPLEDMLRDLERLLEKEAMCRFPEEYLLAQSLREKWEDIRIHPQLESLAEREIFSERLAVLLAKHWPKSAVLWSRLRNFFAWQPPVFSDDSALGLALRALFDNADNEEIPDPVPIKKTWKEYWREFRDFICYPGTLLIFLLRISRTVFDERPVPEPAISSWQAVKAFLSDLGQVTWFVMRISVAIFLLLLCTSLSVKIIHSPKNFIPVLLILCFAYAFHVEFLPGIHDAKAFDFLLFGYRAGVARFFVLYLWTIILFTSIISVYWLFL